MEIETISKLKTLIQTEAQKLGFSECAFVPVQKLVQFEEVYSNWIANEHHASMSYMERNVEKRINPELLVENAKTVIVFLHRYNGTNELLNSKYKIARYAYGSDYHKVIKDKLFLLAEIIDQYQPNSNVRCFTDSAPVLERAWAYLGGLGWFGKNSCLISQKHGSFFFISEIITSVEFEINNAKLAIDRCGSCSRCIDACPTSAINPNKTINSNKCISFHTIENKGEIPNEIKANIANQIFGCDICQQVCPWNRKAEQADDLQFQITENIKKLANEGINAFSSDEFKQKFKQSPISRAGFEKIQQNIEIGC
jgi:epoxyqueuosine reductase